MLVDVQTLSAPIIIRLMGNRSNLLHALGILIQAQETMLTVETCVTTINTTIRDLRSSKMEN